MECLHSRKLQLRFVWGGLHSLDGVMLIISQDHYSVVRVFILGDVGFIQGCIITPTLAHHFRPRVPTLLCVDQIQDCFNFFQT